MTSFDLPLRRIAIEAFRGFRDRQDFDLAASAVIVSGPNGTGKTSFFDAIQWCLLGSIERLEDLRARKSVEHIVNQYRLNDRATVEVEMAIGAKVVNLRRTGDRSGSTLELTVEGDEPLFGADAEQALANILVPSDGLTLDVALTTSGLMQQDVMRAVLEAKPADRYKHISTVLGLGALEDFEDAVVAVAKKAKEAEETARDHREIAGASLEKARERLESASNRMANLPRVDQLTAEIRSKLEQAPDGLAVRELRELTGSQDLQDLAAHTGSLIQSLGSFQSLWETRRGTEAVLSDEQPSDEARRRLEEQLGAARETLEVAQSEVEVAESQLRTAEAASEEMVRLAALAIPLLSEECPVCGQAIDPEHVERELRSRASGTDTAIALRGSVESAHAQRDESREVISRLESQLASLNEARRYWNEASLAADRARDAFASLPGDGPISIAVSAESELARRLPSILDYVRELRDLLLNAIDALEGAIDHGDVVRAESEVTNLSEELAAKNVRVEEASERSQRLKSLADATVEARVEVTEQRFRAIQPLVADVFERLDPHPAFKAIEFELDTYYRRGTTTPMVRDMVAGVRADPLMVLSTSQANIVALSYFLAMGWSAGERRLPFVLLDDPIQSMDDVNVLGFADLCRYFRRERQLLISTHERRFARLLERKLAPRMETDSTLVLDFVAWDRSGPAVESHIVAPQLLEDPIRVVRAAS